MTQGSGGPQHTLVDSLRYDGWQRVLEAEYLRDGASVLTEFFTYDARGNVSLGQTGWTFASPGNHLLSNPVCTSFTYDAAGNATQKVCSGLATTYTYDALDRLTMAAPPGGPTAYYTYDALGQRIAKLVGGIGITRFVWRGGHVVYETDSGTQILRSYTWGSSTDDLLVARDHGTGWRYYVVQDRLRSVRALVRSDGAWQAGWRYQAFGTLLQAEGSEPFPVRFRWAGAQYDAETGLYYLRNRYYDPSMGRFTQEDPIGYAGSGNLFAYGGDPTTGRDPDGLAMDYEYAAMASADPNNPMAGCMGTWDGCGGGGSALDAWIAESEMMYLEFVARSTSYTDYRSAYDERVAGGTYVGAPVGTEALSEAAFDVVKDAIVRLLDLRSQALSSADNAYAVSGLTGMLSSGRFASVPNQSAIGGAAAEALWNRGNPRIIISSAFFTNAAYQPFQLAHEWGHIHYHHERGFRGNEVAADHFAVRATGQRICLYAYSRCDQYRP